MAREAAPGFSFDAFQALGHAFRFEEFQAVAPVDGRKVWEFVLDRNQENISVKRRDVALENLERIFIATFRLANTLGFNAMTLRDLCRETGLSMGGLYGYIDGKDRLAFMIEDVVRHLSEYFPVWFGHIEAPLQQLEARLRAYLYFSELLHPWFYFVFMESRTLSQEQRTVAKDTELGTQHHISAVLEQAARLPSAEAYLLAAHCMALVQEWQVKRWKFRTANVHVDVFADSVLDLIRARFPNN
ncbi:TetR/AcrR family transcriptional regulator [Noviherbaspirillum galbum]|uniref:TetR/AcrR family transcriptional regulator n=1 Tax=Noviherbaspirillum galbum TaxID=2709383 RepID=A0A6B3SGH7_9BURK|nr:TetR family transcriptional regulator [Noviherbaspirillum galbum]NEX59951.1 TetR/AcrR family transcriptional regulator [Noviherbaspirillum galbum]